MKADVGAGKKRNTPTSITEPATNANAA